MAFRYLNVGDIVFYKTLKGGMTYYRVVEIYPFKEVLDKIKVQMVGKNNVFDTEVFDKKRKKQRIFKAWLLPEDWAIYNGLKVQLIETYGDKNEQTHFIFRGAGRQFDLTYQEACRDLTLLPEKSTV